MLTFAAKELRQSTIFEHGNHINNSGCCCQAEVAAEDDIRCGIGCVTWQEAMTAKAVDKASGGEACGCIKYR